MVGKGFFGKDYIEGDNGLEGFLPGKRESLNERTIREVKGVIDSIIGRIII
jgi:hypothetical protein